MDVDVLELARKAVAAAAGRLAHASRLSDRSRDILVISAFHAAVEDPLELMSLEDVGPYADDLGRVGVVVFKRLSLIASGTGALRVYSVEPIL